MVKIWKIGKEAALLRAYLQNKYPDNLTWTRVKLGPLPSKELARMYMSNLRWADAIVFDGHDVIIIEAKVRNDAGIVGQLELYKSLFPKTLAFKALWKQPLKMQILVPVPSLDLMELASSKNIDYVVFPWAEVNKVRIKNKETPLFNV